MLKRELIRYATLAPSSHNTQCWKFQLGPFAIFILPDLARRCPAVDPDNHHLFVSLGCASENLVLAALANGFSAQPRLNLETGEIIVTLETSKPFVSPLFQAIPQRQCTRAEFDGTALSPAELLLLEKAGTGDGVHLMLFTDPKAIEKILEYVVAGNNAQMNDTVFLKNSKHGLATALGIRNAMINQPVEVQSLRPQLATYLGIGNLRPDLIVRFGRGSLMPRSLRRPVDEVLI